MNSNEKISNDDSLWYNGNIKICLLKKIYKTSVLFNVYNLLAIDFRYEEDLDCFNFIEVEEKSMIISKSFFEDLYKYLNLLQILQLILNYMDCDLSSHSEKIIDLNIINYYYEKLTRQEDIIQELNSSKQKIYSSCIHELKKIRRLLNE